MSDEGLRHARDVMRADGADDDAIEVFAHY